MNGSVDDRGRALVRISLRSATHNTTVAVDAWVDTGFTGALVLSQAQIAEMGLPHSAVVTAELADGTMTTLAMYSCLLEWFGSVRQVEAITSAGVDNLLGVELLNRHTLTIDYAARAVTIE